MARSCSASRGGRTALGERSPAKPRDAPRAHGQPPESASIIPTGQEEDDLEKTGPTVRQCNRGVVAKLDAPAVRSPSALR